MQILKKNKVEFVSAEFGVYLMSSPSGSDSSSVRWCPHLALGSLFKTASTPQSAAVFFRHGCIWAGPHYSALLAFYQQKVRGGPSNIQQHCRYHLHLPLEGTSGGTRRVGSLDISLGRCCSVRRCCSVFREDCGCVFPTPALLILV